MLPQTCAHACTLALSASIYRCCCLILDILVIRLPLLLVRLTHEQAHSKTNRQTRTQILQYNLEKRTERAARPRSRASLSDSGQRSGTAPSARHLSIGLTSLQDSEGELVANVFNPLNQQMTATEQERSRDGVRRSSRERPREGERGRQAGEKREKQVGKAVPERIPGYISSPFMRPPV
jgi:hypothetical protein